MINVVGNKLQGKGVENINDYPFITAIKYLNMENIHVLRNGYEEMRFAFS